MAKYQDIADHDEDTRIKIIAERARKQVVIFITDTIPGKANRYIQKLKVLYPEIVVYDQFLGPVPETITVKVGPP